MKGLRIGLAGAVVALASYGLACAAEGPQMARRAARAISAAAPPPGLAQRLAGVRGQGQATTRGAKEADLYRAAAPSVVLVATKEGVGSGVLISADGKILTNRHVVEDAEYVAVIFKPAAAAAEATMADARFAKVLKRDAVADLALIQVKEIPAGVKPLALATAEVTVGSDVHAIGHPDGQTWTYTRGIVSQVRPDYPWETEEKIPHKATVIQTQTPINPGNSGGPLLDDAMGVVGVNTFKGEGEGISFAVSAADIRAFLARTEDREAPPAPACDGEVLEEHHDAKEKGVYTTLDADCDGVRDTLVFTPDNRKKPVEMAVDSDQNGKIDQILYDADRNDDFEVAEFDSDEDGVFDIRGYYKPGEDEPYRMERIED